MNLKQKLFAGIAAAAALLLAGFIFSNSLRDAARSNAQSDRVIEVVEGVAEHVGVELPRDTLSHYVRKAAHYTEFFLLGAACYAAAAAFRRGRPRLRRRRGHRRAAAASFAGALLPGDGYAAGFYRLPLGDPAARIDTLPAPPQERERSGRRAFHLIPHAAFAASGVSPKLPYFGDPSIPAKSPPFNSIRCIRRFRSFFETPLFRRSFHSGEKPSI